MDFRETSIRIREIKKEIYEINQKVNFSIQDKIQALKLINTLLREQNQLLAIKQSLSTAA